MDKNHVNDCPKCKQPLRSTLRKLNGCFVSSINDYDEGLLITHWKCGRCDYTVKEYLTLPLR